MRLILTYTLFSNTLSLRSSLSVGDQVSHPCKTYLLTFCMVQSPSWEVNRFAASQEIPRIFMEPEGSLPHSQASATWPLRVIGTGSIRSYISELKLPDCQLAAVRVSSSRGSLLVSIQQLLVLLGRRRSLSHLTYSLHPCYLSSILRRALLPCTLFCTTV